MNTQDMEEVAFTSTIVFPYRANPMINASYTIFFTRLQIIMDPNSELSRFFILLQHIRCFLKSRQHRATKVFQMY